MMCKLSLNMMATLSRNNERILNLVMPGSRLPLEIKKGGATQKLQSPHFKIQQNHLFQLVEEPHTQKVLLHLLVPRSLYQSVFKLGPFGSLSRTSGKRKDPPTGSTAVLLARDPLGGEELLCLKPKVPKHRPERSAESAPHTSPSCWCPLGTNRT